MTTIRTPLMDISNNDSSPVASNRRKSGRAVKVPEKFVPELPSSQVAPSSSKRKRGDDDAENGVSELEEEDEEDLEDEESEEEVVSAAEEEIKESRRKAKIAKKPVAKKPKTNGTTHKAAAKPRATQSAAPAVRLPNRSRKGGKGKKVLIADKDAEGLYAEIFTSGKHADDVAGQFLADYQEDPASALADLVNMVLKSAGCDLQVTTDDIEDTDNVTGKLGDLQDEFQSTEFSDYPLISKAKSSVDFRNAYVDFFDALIKAVNKSGLMYNDQPLMENVCVWLETMSSSTSRPFRHTSTLAVLTITSALCLVADTELKTAANIRQQAKSEKAKGGNKGRIAQFQKNLETSENKSQLVKDRLQDLFSVCFVHRYRDIDPKIRVDCMEALGTWIQTYPETFGEGAYLRYEGWMLSDVYAPVRLQVVAQLIELMKEPNFQAKMATFIERFRPRLIEIVTSDVDPVVRSAAVELADLIRDAGMLEPNDVDIIGKLIYDAEPRVRKSVAGFFLAGVQDTYDGKVLDLGGEEELEILASGDENLSTPRKEWIKLQSLAELLESYDIEDKDEDDSQISKNIDLGYLDVSTTETRFTLAAQAIYDQLPEIKDWLMVANYLLYDHSAQPAGNKSLRAIKSASKPNEKQEVILLDMLHAAVSTSLSSLDEHDHSKGRKMSKQDIVEAKETAARRLADIIPRLLKKFGATPATATIVLRLEHVLNLAVFQELRQDNTTYGKLLDEISTQFNGHGDRIVLKEAGQSLLHARKYEELEEVTETKISSLWDNTITALQEINAVGSIEERGGFSEAVLTELSHTLARLDKLASISNCIEALEADAGDGSPPAINILLSAAERGMYTEEHELEALEDKVVLSATRATLFYFLWKVRAITDSISNGREISEANVDTLNEQVERFIESLIIAISSRSTLDPLRLSASGALLDIYVLLAEFRHGKSPHTRVLLKQIDSKVQKELTSIFVAAEKHFAKKSHKKLVDRAVDEEPEDDEAEPSDDSDDEDEEATEHERTFALLRSEQQLCELTGRLILALIAKVIDQAPPHAGKLLVRLKRNQAALGPNYRGVIAKMDDHKPKPKRVRPSRAKASDASKSAKSKETVSVDDEDEEEEEVAPEEGSEEDLRRRGVVEDEEESVANAGEADAGADAVVEAEAEADEEDIMSD